MSDLTEKIIKDILELDPSLADREKELRNLVTVLLRSKPDIKVDIAFAQNLRSDLLQTNVQAKESKSKISWWTYYLAPVGVLAVLFIMLIPNYLSKSTSLQMIPLDTPSDSYLQSDEVQIESATMKRSATDDEEQATFMQMSTAPMPEFGFGISTQEPGKMITIDFASLHHPGFIVIQTFEEGEMGSIIGASPFLIEGQSESVLVPLTVEIKFDQTFYAVLYNDNGDGIFNPDKDKMFYDEYGLPLYQLFSTTPSALE